MVRRSRDPQDRRAWLLSLTPDGVAKRDRLVAAMSELFQRISGLDPDEMHTQLTETRRQTLADNAMGLLEGALKRLTGRFRQ